jgi:hypothetical protein
MELVPIASPIKTRDEESLMKSRLAFAVLLLASLAQAQDPKKYRTGRLLQMESLQCTVFENPSSNANAADATICQEYVVQGDDVLFHLRPKDTKHPALLPIGKEVGYRIDEDRFFLHTSTDGKKEREYLVVSIESRGSSTSPVQTAMKVNHLQ